MTPNLTKIVDSMSKTDLEGLKQSINEVWDDKKFAVETPYRIKIFLSYLLAYRLEPKNIAHFPLNSEEMKRYIDFIEETEYEQQ